MFGGYIKGFITGGMIGAAAALYLTSKSKGDSETFQEESISYPAQYQQKLSDMTGIGPYQGNNGR